VSRELREEQELIDKLFAPQQRLADGQKILQRALDGGRISAQQYADALALLGNRANDAAAKMNPLRQTLLDLQAESKELELLTSGLFGDVEVTAQRRIRDVDQQGGFAGLTPDQRKTGEDAIRSETARNELLRQQAGLYQDIVGPVREYESTLAAANAQAAKTPELVGALQRRVDEARVRMLEGSTAVGDGFERAFLKAKLAGEDFASAAEQAVGRFADIATDSINRFLETGEFSFRQFASSILTEIQRIIVRMLVLQALGAAFGGAGGVVTAAAGTQGFAEGGTTQPGRSYIVGERGPELFSPGRTGSVTPNASSAGGQAPQVNVQVVTVEDPQLVPSTIAGGAADEVIVQAIGRNRDRVRQVIG
jgi:lambda family phage tail tape measure protein